MFKKLSRLRMIVLLILSSFSACVTALPTVTTANHTLGNPTPPAITVTAQAKYAFQVGWWVDRDIGNPQVLATYSAEGDTLALLTGSFCTTSQLITTKAYLDEAGKHNMKAIVGLVCDQIPTMTAEDFTYTINALKDHSALYGYYLGDEPDIREGKTLHQHLAVDPGYYYLVKAADPNHPVFITFDRAGHDTEALFFFDVLDTVGVHSYPFWSTRGEFENDEARNMYDTWKFGLEAAQTHRKQGFIATVQGFGDNTMFPYRNPTYSESRYQIFTAVVLGVDKVLFWMDSWAEQGTMMGLVRQMVGQLQSIGTEMNNGTTNDPIIKVSQPVSKLVFRYGINGNSHAILAINIANRSSEEGATLSNVKFTLPSEVNVSSVEVLYENRTIPVYNRVFTDTFLPFEVHIYRFYS